MYRLSIALLVCLALPTLSQDKSATARFLQELQTAQGGFRNDAGDAHGRATIMATAASLRALALIGAAPLDKSACVRFVVSCRDAASGGICERPGGKATVLSTAMGLMAMGELGRIGAVSPEKSGATVDAAVVFVEKNSRTTEEIRMALAGMEAVGIGAAKAKAWYDELLPRQLPERSSDSLRDIASALVIAQRTKRDVPLDDELKAILADGQSSDGGYRRPERQASDLETTYVVGRALHMVKSEPKSQSRCRDFVRRCRNVDGGYGMTPGQPSQAIATYFALSILNWLEHS